MNPYLDLAPDSDLPGEWHLPLLDALAHAPFPALVHAEDGEVLQVSAAWTELSGYEPRDIPTIAAWTRAAYGDGETAAREDIRSLFERRTRVDEGECRIRTRDGGVRVWSFSSASLGVLRDGRRVVLSMAADVTERVRADRARRRAQARWRFLARAGQALVSTLDAGTVLRRMARLSVPALADGCVVHVVEPDGTLTRLGATRAGGPAKMLPRVPVPAPPADHALARALAAGEPAHLSGADVAWTLVLTSDDAVPPHLHTVDALVVPLTARGRTLGVATFLRGAARRPYTRDDMAVAQALVRRAALAVDNGLLYEESEAASRAKSNFLAVVSHELKTPLNAIIGYAGLLAEAGPGAGERERGYLDRIDQRAGDLLAIVEQMLAVAQMESAPERTHWVEVDLAEVVARTAVPAAEAARNRGLEFAVAVDGPLPVRTDPERVELILSSLLSNAVKFTESGGVRVTARRSGGAVEVEVRDTGIGIAREHLDTIFQPFWQAQQGTTRAWEGMGLGLTVAHRLAHLLGGEVEVRSAPGDGSAFVLRLPA